MKRLRRSEARGRANFGWLDSRHSFSFGSYYDPNHMGFSALRVINDDHVEPGAGFGTHGHQDMEIISCVLQGELAHEDSEGNVERLPAGEFQLMSAGAGIRHSEFNGSATEPLRFLQIWILPAIQGRAPSYQQKDFGEASGLTLVASPDGAEGSLVLKQDARLSQLLLEPGAGADLPTASERSYYVHVIEGSLAVAGEILLPGDGLALTESEALAFTAGQDKVRALVFDLP